MSPSGLLFTWSVHKFWFPNMFSSFSAVTPAALTARSKQVINSFHGYLQSPYLSPSSLSVLLFEMVGKTPICALEFEASLNPSQRWAISMPQKKESHQHHGNRKTLELSLSCCKSSTARFYPGTCCFCKIIKCLWGIEIDVEIEVQQELGTVSKGRQSKAKHLSPVIWKSKLV